VVSDFCMPELDGISFLTRAQTIAPHTVRLLFTGHADLEVALAAVNEGRVFRFLTKPSSPHVVRNAVEAAVAQYLLITAERELLENTLQGCVKTLTNFLSLTNPAAFGRASRAQWYVSELLAHENLTACWYIGMAALLSQIGCVALPAETAERMLQGLVLADDEEAMVRRLPGVAEQLLASIPRLEPVREILRYQAKHFDGEGWPQDDAVAGRAIPLGARMLKIVLDFDALESEEVAVPVALDIMRGRAGWYDPSLLDKFVRLRGGATTRRVVREVAIAELVHGMILADDVLTSSGALLVTRGCEINAGLLERLRNNLRFEGVRQPLRVLVK